MKKLYVCEYPYVLYKLLIERMGDEENSYSLILSDSFVDLGPMLPVLRQSGLFDRVEFFSSAPYRYYYDLLLFDFPKSQMKKALAILKNQLTMSLRQKEFMKISFPFDLDFEQYDQIICTDHPCVINGYLSTNHIEYKVFEHAHFRYQLMSKCNDYFLCLLNILDKLHILYGMSPATKYCTEIIVDSAVGLARCIRHKKISAWDVDEHIGYLNEQQKDQIFQLYADAYKLKTNADQTYDLLLTSPLYTDAFLPSEETQIEFYKDVIRDHFNHSVLIKPHPRDTVNYHKYFPECTIVDPNISSEVLCFSQQLKLDTVLTLFSSSINSFNSKTDKLIVLEPHIPNALPSKIESLKTYW